MARRASLPRAEVAAALAPDTAVCLGPSRSLLRYLMDGGTQVNVAAFARTDTWTGQGWSQPADGAAIEAAFEGWHEEPRAIARTVARRGTTQRGRSGIPYLDSWRHGRVVLARAFALCDDVAAAPAGHERARFERGTTTMRRADRQGLRIHGYIAQAHAQAGEPRDDFEEYGYDAASVVS